MRNERNHLDSEIRTSFVTLREFFDTTTLGNVIETLGINKIIDEWHLMPAWVRENLYSLANLCGVDLWLTAKE